MEEEEENTRRASSVMAANGHYAWGRCGLLRRRSTKRKEKGRGDQAEEQRWSEAEVKGMERVSAKSR